MWLDLTNARHKPTYHDPVRHPRVVRRKDLPATRKGRAQILGLAIPVWRTLPAYRVEMIVRGKIGEVLHTRQNLRIVGRQDAEGLGSDAASNVSLPSRRGNVADVANVAQFGCAQT